MPSKKYKLVMQCRCQEPCGNLDDCTGVLRVTKYFVLSILRSCSPACLHFLIPFAPMYYLHRMKEMKKYKYHHKQDTLNRIRLMYETIATWQ